MKTKFLGLTCILLLVHLGCEKKTQTAPVSIPNIEAEPFLAVRSLDEAPRTTRDGARAVVSIELRGRHIGNGFFVKEGVFFTSTQVLGPQTCFVEGCLVTIFANYEITEKPRAFRALVTPVFMDRKRNLSAWRAIDPETKQKIVIDGYLEFSNEPVQQGDPVTLIGSPITALKRFVEGQVLDVENTRISTDMITLGGQSGAPVLNAASEVIAVTCKDEENSSSEISRSGNVLTHSSFCRAQSNWDSSPGNSLDAFASRSRGNSFFPLHLNSLNPSIEMAGAAFSFYLSQCQKNTLAGLSINSKDCLSLLDWTSCDPQNKFGFCPDTTTKQNFLSYLSSVDDDDLSETLFKSRYVYALESTPKSASAATLTFLKNRIKQTSLGPRAAWEVLKNMNQGAGTEFNGLDLEVYFKNYSALPGYQREYFSIAQGLLHLHSEFASVSAQELTQTLNALLRSREISLEQMFQIEDMVYRFNSKLRPTLSMSI